MKKINFSQETLLSAGVLIGTGLLTLLKNKKDTIDKAKAEEELIKKVTERLSKKED